MEGGKKGWELLNNALKALGSWAVSPDSALAAKLVKFP